MANPTPDSYTFTPGVTFSAGRPVPPSGGDVLLTSFTLVNETVTEQAAGFVTKSFGHSFKKGEIPSGEWPNFTTVDDVACPYTCWGKTTWNDGSLKFLAAMVRFPQTVPAMGSRTMRVYSGGSAPAAGALTLADLTAYAIQVEATGVTNLTGVWLADLNDAITRGDDVQTWGNGPAGALFSVGSEFRDGSAAAQGQMYCRFYLMVTLDGAGEIAGVRRLEHVTQLWADVASPAPIHRDMVLALKQNGATLRTMEGYTTAGGSLTTTVRIPHWSSAMTAQKDGHFNYVPGTVAADTVVRVVPNTTYARQTFFVPPFDQSLAVVDMATADYDISGKGNHAGYSMGGTGEREEIGLFPQWAAKYWINPNAANERALRVNALCQSGYSQEGRAVATRKPTPAAGPTFTGLGAPKTAWTIRSGFVAGGPISATGNLALWGTDTAHRPGPAFAAYLSTGEPQYLELMLGAAFGHVLASEPGYRAVYNNRPIATTPNDYFGARGMRINNALPEYPVGGIIGTGGGTRVGAWKIRDIGQACAICPDAHPDGADYKGYLEYVVQNAHEGFNDLAAGHPAPYRDSGLFITYSKATITDVAESPWMDNYWILATAHLSKITENAEAVAAREYFAKKFSSLDAIANPLLLGSYRYQGFTVTGIVESYADVMFTLDCTLTFSTSGNTVTLTPKPIYAGTWDFTNGDVFMIPTNTLDAGAQPYSIGGDFVNFYVVNASGKTCQFSDTLGGAPLTVVRNATAVGCYGRVKTTSTGFTPGHSIAGGTAIASATGTANYLEALGEPVGAAAAKMRAALAVSISPSTFEVEPKYAFTPTIPA